MLVTDDRRSSRIMEVCFPLASTPTYSQKSSYRNPIKPSTANNINMQLNCKKTYESTSLSAAKYATGNQDKLAQVIIEKIIKN
jgi:hypothetical protein